MAYERVKPTYLRGRLLNLSNDIVSNYNYRMQVKDTFEGIWKGAVVTSYRRYLSIYLEELQKHKKPRSGQSVRRSSLETDTSEIEITEVKAWIPPFVDVVKNETGDTTLS